jgi:hypothetical protein
VAGSGGAISHDSGPVVLAVDTLYGPTSDDQLTLVTSADKEPWNTSHAAIVVAKLLTKPFAPSAQGGRTDSQSGTSGDSGAWASALLAIVGFVGVIVGSVVLYRKMRFRIAYVLTIAPLVALTVIAGEAIARLLPAWT